MGDRLVQTFYVSVFSCRFHWLGTVSCRKENYVHWRGPDMAKIYATHPVNITVTWFSLSEINKQLIKEFENHIFTLGFLTNTMICRRLDSLSLFDKVEFPAKRTRVGTSPPGSQWTRSSLTWPASLNLTASLFGWVVKLPSSYVAYFQDPHPCLYWAWRW